MDDLVTRSPEADALTPFEPYDGTTYYGRAQLKPAPFDNKVVGAYIFLAGMSGGVALLTTLADVSDDQRLQRLVRRGRYLALLAPVLGAPLLIYDLHTPKRFYNMLRVAKATSPMSIGTWILMSFSGAAGLAALAQVGSDLWPNRRWFGTVARLAGVPAALSGMGLSFYTAALMSATSTPVWAAAPKTLAVRYAASSVASAAALLSLGESEDAATSKLSAIEGVALAVEAVATVASTTIYRDKGVEDAFDSKAGAAERLGAVGVGLLLPLGLLAISALLGRRGRHLRTAASAATLVGSATMRVSMLEVGAVSAARPHVSFRFSTPRNLPLAEHGERTDRLPAGTAQSR